MNIKASEFNLRLATQNDLANIKKLYNSAFPAKERKPFFLVTKEWKRKTGDIFVLCENDAFLGFATTVIFENLVMIDYLAISTDCRGSGVGSFALAKIGEHYEGKKIFLLIEKPNEKAKNNAQRVKRKAFYFKNGYIDTKIRLKTPAGEMQILGYKQKIKPKDYERLQEASLGKFVMWLSGIKVIK